MRRIFVGDIQGCREELEELLERVRFDPASDELHPVGDLVNRGPDSLGTLRLLMSLEAGGVLGNHDLHLLAVANGSRELKHRDTFQGVLEAPDAKTLLNWMAGRPFLRTWKDLFLVHAAIHPLWEDPRTPLEKANPHHPSEAAMFAVRTRYCNPKGQVPVRDGAPPKPPFKPWHTFYHPERHGGRRVVYGHWAVQGLHVEKHALGLDSGCVWGHHLTAWVAEEDRIVQVEARRSYAQARGD